MSDKPWKAFERESAALIKGQRFWANSGCELDVASDGIVGQCKHVQSLSLQALTQLVEMVEAQGQTHQKLGHVFVKHRGGKGKATTPLVVMSFETYRKLTFSKEAV